MPDGACVVQDDGEGEGSRVGGRDGGGIEKVPSCRITHPQSVSVGSAIVTATILVLSLIADSFHGHIKTRNQWRYNLSLRSLDEKKQALTQIPVLVSVECRV